MKRKPPARKKAKCKGCSEMLRAYTHASDEIQEKLHEIKRLNSELADSKNELLTSNIDRDYWMGRWNMQMEMNDGHVRVPITEEFALRNELREATAALQSYVASFDEYRRKTNKEIADLKAKEYAQIT